MNGVLFLEASKVLHTYSPKSPNIHKISPEDKSNTHIRVGQPATGVPTVKYSTNILAANMTEKIKNSIPVIHISLIGRYEKLTKESNTNLNFLANVHLPFPDSLSFL